MAATSTAKQPTYRLFKVAAELNIGKETIVEFLKGKGFEISDKPTSALSQEMYDLVMDKFEKEHRQIEKQRKKVGAYHEKRVRPSKEEEHAAGEGETPAPVSVPAPEAEQPEAPVAPEVQPPAPEVISTPEPVVVEAEPTAPVQPEPVVADEPAPVRVEPKVEEVIAAVEPPVSEKAPVVEEQHVAPTPVVEQPVAREEAPVAEPVIEQAPVIEEAPVARREVVEAPVERRAEEIPAEQPVAREEAPVVEPEKPAPTMVPHPVITTAAEGVAAHPHDDPKNKGFASSPPTLQGLTVLGRIELPKKAVPKKEEKGTRKRKRIREAVKSVDISQEAQSRASAIRPTPGERIGGGTGPGGPPRPAGTTGAPGTGGGSAADKKKKARGRGGVGVDQGEVSRAIAQTMSRMGDSRGSSRQKRSRDKRDQREERATRAAEAEMAESAVLTVTEFLTVAELANLMNVDVAQVIGKCIGLGLMVAINQRLEKDTIQLVADEFGYTVEFQADYAEDLLVDTEDEPETMAPRAPIVTIMGHVDHGKTSLLDYIRRANVVAGESGGITQHIGAYAVKLPDGRAISFLDTPGHEAFTAMRARGAQLTDIVVLVVAADDSVMPQTIEAISHAQAANVPMVIAINKVDKPDSNPERIRQQLSDRGVLVEEWGGKYQAVEISAKQGTGVDKLLDTILLEAEILDLKARADRNARGVVVEAEIDKGKGIIATVLIQKGTLKVGDDFVAGQHYGRVRALLDERGHRLEQVGPSEPAQVLGFSGVPTAGDVLVVLDSEQDAREIANRRKQLRREQDHKQVRHITLDEISSQIARGGVQHLPLVIKGDVDGSVEALADSLIRLSNPEVQVSVVLKSVGEITESDVLLATASNAIIIGFHVRPNLKARKLAEREGVEVRTYQIIYDAVNEVRAALEGMLRPEQKEVITGTVEIRDIFKISRFGLVAGCMVLDGKITRNDKIRVLRDGLEIFSGSLASLKRVKDDVKEVEQGFECGLTIDGLNDIRVSDIIEAYKFVEVKRKLESAASYQDSRS
jgi:translation initiation factor IF-2